MFAYCCNICVSLLSEMAAVLPYISLIRIFKHFHKIKTAFTQSRRILEMVKNETAAKLELAFTRYRNNLKTVGT